MDETKPTSTRERRLLPLLPQRSFTWIASPGGHWSQNIVEAGEEKQAKVAFGAAAAFRETFEQLPPHQEVLTQVLKNGVRAVATAVGILFKENRRRVERGVVFLGSQTG